MMTSACSPTADDVMMMSAIGQAWMTSAIRQNDVSIYGIYVADESAYGLLTCHVRLSTGDVAILDDVSGDVAYGNC